MRQNDMPRPEFPNPQFERKQWINLNGEWDFAFDHGMTGLERGFEHGGHFTHKITVPFAPESERSGIHHQDFMRCVWYGKTIRIPEAWDKGRIFLTFGAVDYYAELYLEGKRVSMHQGTSAPYTTDITPFVHVGDNQIVLRVTDDTRSGIQTLGKQSTKYAPHGCWYTRTTGIWQTVWLEYVPAQSYIKGIKLTPDVGQKTAHLEAALCHSGPERCTLTATAYFDGTPVCSASCETAEPSARLALCLKDEDLHLWDVGQGNLYDLVLTLQSASGTDTVWSYFGMRSLSLTDNALCINGRPVFQRLVLDQGYYPDGVWTAPTDQALEQDILLSLKAGFNGARLHQKVFEPRYLYHADRHGYLVWGENASWGLDLSNPAAFEGFFGEWASILAWDYNHPSIIGWCPFNETHIGQKDVCLANLYDMTKVFDPTRPVIDTSGYVHVKTDLFDEHDYEQDPKIFAAHYAGLNDTQAACKPVVIHDCAMPLTKRLPYFVSEYGGTWWNEAEAKQADAEGWGYGERPRDIEEVYHRIEGLTAALLNNKGICAFCYTQLTDVHPERNGIYHFDRSEKFDMQRIHRIFSGKAAIENE